MGFLKPFQEQIYALARIVVGFLFLCHGLQKLFGFFGGRPGPMEEGGGQAVMLWAASFIETIGGALVALGLLAGPAAFLCSGTMAVAYFMVHQFGPYEGLFPIQNQGELAALYAWVFLFIAAKGSGTWSLDEARGA